MLSDIRCRYCLHKTHLPHLHCTLCTQCTQWYLRLCENMSRIVLQYFLQWPTKFYYCNRVYYWNECDTYLYRLDLMDIKNVPFKIVAFKKLNALIARGDFILAVDRFREGDPQKATTTIRIWKLSPDGSKKDLLMSDNWGFLLSRRNPYNPHTDCRRCRRKRGRGFFQRRLEICCGLRQRSWARARSE